MLEHAEADARRAIALAPELAEGHLALAKFFEYTLDFAQASREFDRAMMLAPGNSRVLRNYAVFAANMGRLDEGVDAAQRAVRLDPFEPLVPR